MGNSWRVMIVLVGSDRVVGDVFGSIPRVMRFVICPQVLLPKITL
jgi:hypothetical protein